MRRLASATLCLLLTTGAGAASTAVQPAAPEAGRGWELVGSWGWHRTVYVEPARIEDRKLLAGAIRSILAKSGTSTRLQIDFFDDRASTPAGREWVAANYRHHRARYNFTPRTRMSRFAWIEYVPITPGDLTRTKRVETVESLPPP